MSTSVMKHESCRLLQFVSILQLKPNQIHPDFISCGLIFAIRALKFLTQWPREFISLGFEIRGAIAHHSMLGPASVILQKQVELRHACSEALLWCWSFCFKLKFVCQWDGRWDGYLKETWHAKCCHFYFSLKFRLAHSPILYLTNTAPLELLLRP